MITDQLFENIEQGRLGKLWGYSMGLPKLESMIDGVTKGTYTLLFAGSGIGKSNLMLYSFIYRPLMEHLYDGKFKITMFALEMKADILLAKLLSTYIFEKYHIDLSFKEIYSKKKGYVLPEEYLQIVKECEPWLRQVETLLTIHDKAANADSIYAILMNELEQRGKFSETESRKIYTPDDPDLTHLVIVDHAGKLRQKDGRSKKQEIDTLSSYFVYLRNICNISPLMLMQSNRDQSSSARRQLGMFLPQMSDVKETNEVYEDVDITLAIYNPSVDKLKTHNGYDITQMGDNFRSIVVIKSRYGESNIEDCCYFNGKCNVWQELPRPGEIYDYSKYNTLDWLKEELDQEKELDNNTNSNNFIL